jgi:hypothetical protein
VVAIAFRGTGFAPGGYDYITMISPQLDRPAADA